MQKDMKRFGAYVKAKLARAWPSLLLTFVLVSVWRNQMVQMDEFRGLRELLQKVQASHSLVPTETAQTAKPVQAEASTRRELAAGTKNLRDCAPREVGGREKDKYGAWTLCVDNLTPGSIVYSFGIGGDVSFDNAMVDAGFQVFGFDPTVTEQQVKGLFVSNHRRPGIPSGFRFSQIGLGTEDGVVSFLKHNNPKITSMTAVSEGLTANYKRGEKFEAPVLRLRTIMGSQPHAWVDVLKIDIEGVEFDVFLGDEFDAMPTIPADQILIEFHDRMVANGKEKHEKVRRVLEAKGFFLRWVARSNQEALFVRVKPREFFLPANNVARLY